MAAGLGPQLKRKPLGGREPSVNSDLRPLFAQIARDFFAAHPQIPHEWQATSSGIELLVPAKPPTGFSVYADVSAGCISIGVTPGGFHDDFEDIGPPKSFQDHTTDVLDWLIPCLSGNVRVREFCANESPYAWQLEYRKDDGWIPGRASARFLRGWFGPKTERVLINNWIPPDTAA